MIGAGKIYLGPVKREAGESPARTRRCKVGVSVPQKMRRSLVFHTLRRRTDMGIAKSEDLPAVYCGATSNWLKHKETVRLNLKRPFAAKERAAKGRFLSDFHDVPHLGTARDGAVTTINKGEIP